MAPATVLLPTYVAAMEDSAGDVELPPFCRSVLQERKLRTSDFSGRTSVNPSRLSLPTLTIYLSLYLFAASVPVTSIIVPT